MSLENTRFIKDALRNCQVLIVEDDIRLAENLAELFKEYTDKDAVIAYCMQTAHEQILQKEFNLAIVDVMLPGTEDDFQKICDYEKILAKIRRTIEKIDTLSDDDKDREKLMDARYKRAETLNQIDNLIRRDGGIELVKEWSRSDSSKIRDIAILYLTAVGNNASIQRGLSAAKGHSDWLVKPVPSIKILEKAMELIQKKKT